MPVPYGDTDQIKLLLGLEGVEDPGIDARLTLLNEAVSQLAEARLGGRAFGSTSPDASQLVWAEADDLLLLPKPIRTITSITTGGSVSGATISGGTPLGSSYWTPGIVDVATGEIRAIRLLAGTVWGKGLPVVVVGQWADQDADGEVPKDVQAAINQVVADHFRLQQASIPGFLGPDGEFDPLRDPWRNILWQQVEEKYSYSSREVVI